jgi:aminoglycoside/choline kinase family phosphotransferase
MRPATKEQAIEWALDYLASNNKDRIISHEHMTETSYSTVYKIITSKNTFYLKQTPPALSTEFQTLAYLHKQQCSHIPTIIAENKALCCFLMESCGDVTLRSFFQEQVDLALLNMGIMNYTKIQRSTEHKITESMNLNTPDWRVERVPFLYRQLIAQEELLLSDGLSKEELAQLNQAYAICTKLCKSLSSYRIPETINHCDFQENNMILDQKTREVSIIDWGETVISHPFFSLCGCLWNMTYFHQIKQGDAIYKQLEQHCITPWLFLHPAPDLLNALKIAQQLTGIFAALSYKRMYDATMNQERTVQQENPGSITGCLRSFLNDSSDIGKGAYF